MCIYTVGRDLWLNEKIIVMQRVIAFGTDKSNGRLRGNFYSYTGRCRRKMNLSQSSLLSLYFQVLFYNEIAILRQFCVHDLTMP